MWKIADLLASHQKLQRHPNLGDLGLTLNSLILQALQKKKKRKVLDERICFKLNFISKQ